MFRNWQYQVTVAAVRSCWKPLSYGCEVTLGRTSFIGLIIVRAISI